MLSWVAVSEDGARGAVCAPVGTYFPLGEPSTEPATGEKDTVERSKIDVVHRGVEIEENNVLRHSM